MITSVLPAAADDNGRRRAAVATANNCAGAGWLSHAANATNEKRRRAAGVALRDTPARQSRCGRRTLEISLDKQIILVRKFKESLEPLMYSNAVEIRKISAGAKYAAEVFGAVIT